MNTQNSSQSKLGLAGKLANLFIQSKLTPVIAITSILLGILSVYLTPKEEEPQISVPMIDIATPAMGFEPAEIERKITEPIERAMWGLDGVEYIYSASQPHGSIVTVRFKVGEPIEPSLVKIHHKLATIKNTLPKNAQNSKVDSYSIDDVPFLVITYSSKDLDDYKLRSMIAPLARELSSTPDLGKVELLGGLKRTVRIEVDPDKLKRYGFNLIDIAHSLDQNDLVLPGTRTWDDSKSYSIEIGGRLESADQVGQISIGQRAGQIIRISDLAKITDGPEVRSKQSIFYSKQFDNQEGQQAVSISLSKRKGTNVVTLSKDILERVHIYQNQLPKEVNLSVLRNYGETAQTKSNELIEHLLIATISVAILIALFMGIRASLVVVIAIPVTLALTLAVYYFMGFTLNRVTLFALIFSIGILVDDAIVVVENIERHFHSSKNIGILKATLNGVSEVGNPTILATFTVIAAILPMAFVRGLMGPYMSPIPVGASLAMILSLFVAFIITPWAAIRLLKKDSHGSHSSETSNDLNKESKLDKIYVKIMNNLLSSKKSALAFGFSVVFLLLGSMSFVYFKLVKVKMLPFDNKNEFQILVDYPTSTTLANSVELSKSLANELLKVNEVDSIQIFSGESAPFSFSGMVKHTFLRNLDYQNDLQIVLKDKHNRTLSSHEVIEKIRPLVKEFGSKNNAITKVLEIPPGPPVLSTLVAEVYGPNLESRRKAAQDVLNVFKEEPSVVDLDYSWREGRDRKFIGIDFNKSGLYGIASSSFAQLGFLTFSETAITELNIVGYPEEVPIVLAMNEELRKKENVFHNQSMPSYTSGQVDLNLVSKNEVIKKSQTLMRKNLRPVEYVMSELSGAEEAPVYGMLKIQPKINYPQQTAQVPTNTQEPIIKWDGEWFITYEVFRDLGGAFAVVMILIYILVLGWFKSFSVPLVIMAPIPISLIGILPGHFLSSAYFTATSMIGFIAGAGIIVRNSIILVDFIEHQLKSGFSLNEAVISAGVLRFRPMLLTAAAVVVGSAVMLFDPIFQGLAVSLIFGEVAATFLSRLAVPILYYNFVGKRRQQMIQKG